jgi:nucleotide-binding universal stress UspA family protein
MKTVLAALDTSAAARPVIETALGIAALTGARVDAVHVSDGSEVTPEWLADQNEVVLRVLRGPVEASLVRALDDDEVIAGVFGARRTPSGRRPVGRTAMHVLERTTKPVVVVPPDVVAANRPPVRRLLVPLEGTTETSQPVLDRLYPLVVAEAEVVVLHVFTSDTLPPVLDRPVRDLSLWGEEFAARFCPVAARVELRTGPVGARVAEMCAEEQIDLVVLSWSQDASAGHAAVIREVLGASTVPVMLLPVAVTSP